MKNVLFSLDCWNCKQQSFYIVGMEKHICWMGRVQAHHHGKDFHLAANKNHKKKNWAVVLIPKLL